MVPPIWPAPTSAIFFLAMSGFVAPQRPDWQRRGPRRDAARHSGRTPRSETHAARKASRTRGSSAAASSISRSRPKPVRDVGGGVPGVDHHLAGPRRQRPGGGGQALRRPAGAEVGVADERVAGAGAAGADPVPHGRVERTDPESQRPGHPEQCREHGGLGVDVPVAVDVRRRRAPQLREAPELAADLDLRLLAPDSAGQPQVEPDRQRPRRREERRLRERPVDECARSRHHPVPVGLEDSLVDGRVVAQVVGNDQGPAHRHPGISTENEAPFPGSPRTRIFPPWASTISRAT